MQFLSRKNSISLSIGVLFVLSLVISFPTIKHAYWGMFSDYIQIVESCRIHIPQGLASCLVDCCLDLRPGAHIPDYLTWMFFPEQPRVFFIEHCLVFFVTLVLTFGGCLRVSRNVPLSLYATSLFFFAKSTYEVLYTLDKGEIFVGCLFALIVWLNAKERNSPKSSLLSDGLVALVAVTYAMFTKQTAQLLVVYSFLSLVFVLLPRHTGKFNVWKSVEALWWYLFTSVSVLAWIVFHIFYRGNGGFSIHRYNEMNYGFASISRKLCDYGSGMPELLTVVAVAILLFVIFLRNASISDSSNYRHCAAVLVTTCVATIALCGWPSEICYIFYPLIPFLSCVLAFALANATLWQRWCALIVLVVVWGAQIPARIEDAQIQLKMDRLFSELEDKLIAVQHQSNSHLSVILPFTDKKGAYEVGNTLRASFSHRKQDQISVANTLRFWNKITENAPDEIKCPNYVPHPGFEKCTLLNGKWNICDVRVGDLVLVPFGDLQPSALNYRGQPMFQRGWQESVGWMSQLKLEPEFLISHDIRRLWQKPAKMGWICLRVNDSPHVSIGCLDDGWYGWVMDGCEVLTDQSCIGKTLALTSRKSHRLKMLMIESERSTITVPAVDDEKTSTFNLPLISNTIRIHPASAHERPLFLIKKVRVFQGSAFGKLSGSS